jgi:uracil-DNA glycosylase family 4
LEEQLEIVNPKVIMALGNTAIQALTNTTYGITKLHGQFLKYKHIPVLCGFHPSYVIRNGSGGPIHAAFKQDLANGHQPNKGRLKCLSIEYVISGILRATLSVALLPN